MVVQVTFAFLLTILGFLDTFFVLVITLGLAGKALLVALVLIAVAGDLWLMTVNALIPIFVALVLAVRENT